MVTYFLERQLSCMEASICLSTTEVHLLALTHYYTCQIQQLKFINIGKKIIHMPDLPLFSSNQTLSGPQMTLLVHRVQ